MSSTSLARMYSVRSFFNAVNRFRMLFSPFVSHAHDGKPMGTHLTSASRTGSSSVGTIANSTDLVQVDSDKKRNAFQSDFVLAQLTTEMGWHDEHIDDLLSKRRTKSPGNDRSRTKPHSDLLTLLLDHSQPFPRPQIDIPSILKPDLQSHFPLPRPR